MINSNTEQTQADAKPHLTLAEYRVLRAQLAADIHSLIIQFQRGTGAYITGLGYNPLESECKVKLGDHI